MKTGYFSCIYKEFYTMRKNVLRILMLLVLLLGIPATLLAQDSIAVGDSVSGEAEGADVEYTIDLTAGETVDIDLQSDDFDTLVRVVDADGNEVAEDDDGGESGLNSLLTLEAPEDGTYTILVTSFFGDPEGAYTLSVSGSTDGGGNVPSGEGDLQVGDSITEDASGNVEYTISLEEGQSISIGVTSDDFDTYLDVLDSDGEIVASDDDGGEGFNSLLAFTAPDSDVYTLLIRSFAGDADGTFTLTVEEGTGGSGGGTADGGTIEYGQTIEVDPAGATSSIFTFEGEEGDVIDLYAVSQGSEDSRLYLYGPDGVEVAQDDDGGGSSNPYIRRFVLPESGTYQIDLQGFGEAALNEPLDLTLEQTELIEITADGVTISLGTTISTEVLAFEATDDTAYLLSVETSEDMESSMYIDLLHEDEDYSATRFSASGASSFAAVFNADDTGTVRVTVQYYGFSGDTDFTISVEPLK
jgi:hypothetical protein